MSKINWLASESDIELISKIARRAEIIYDEKGHSRDIIDIQMDIAACHLNGCPLDLKRMLNADDFNFMHDINGIARHIDRKTGKLKDTFLPRFTLAEE